MGHPKKQRRRYSTPAHMYKGREGEKELVKAYGLKNARELWKAKSEVARIRGLARRLLATPDEKTEKDLLGRLVRTGLVPKGAKLEDVLDLTVENILDRRLQTVAYKKSLTISIKQARQEIVHGHIAVNGQRMTAPGHLTTLEEAESVDFYAGSALSDPDHPIRSVKKKMASTEKAESREVKAEEVKPPGERAANAPEKPGEKEAPEEKKEAPVKEEAKPPEEKAGEAKGPEKEGKAPEEKKAE